MSAIKIITRVIFALQVLQVCAVSVKSGNKYYGVDIAESSKQLNVPTPDTIPPTPVAILPAAPQIPFVDPDLLFDESAIPTGRPEPAGDGTANCGVIVMRNVLGCSCFATFQVGEPPEFPVTTFTRDFCNTFFGPLTTADRFCVGFLGQLGDLDGLGPLMIAQTLVDCFNPEGPLRGPPDAFQ